jgi:hypothetical protein
VEEYRELYVANVTWCGGDRYVVVTSRSRYKNQKKIPLGEENYAIISYTVYSTNEASPTQRHVLLGHYRSSFKQASFPVCKVQVIMPLIGGINGFDESAFKGRFLLCMIDKHLKMIDVVNYKMIDLLDEPNFDQEAIWNMGLTRSCTDRKSRLLLLCSRGSGAGSFV